ncbi:hypothetical protein [Roseinatronobacter monicus]|nr:hypothetical protein [Roseinatronobacter monicus]
MLRAETQSIFNSGLVFSEERGWVYEPSLARSTVFEYALLINGERTNVLIKGKNGNAPPLTARLLKDNGIKLPWYVLGRVGPERVDYMKVVVDHRQLTVKVFVPDEYYEAPHQNRSMRADRFEAGYGAVLSYDLNYRNRRADTQSVDDSIQGRLKGIFSTPFGTLVNTGRVSLLDGALDYRRNETYIEVFNPDKGRIFTFGDMQITPNSDRRVQIAGVGVRTEMRFQQGGNRRTRPYVYFDRGLQRTDAEVVYDSLSLEDTWTLDDYSEALGMPVTRAEDGGLVARVTDENGNDAYVAVSAADNSRLLPEGAIEYQLQAGVARRTIGNTESYTNIPVFHGNLVFGLSDNLTTKFEGSFTQGYQNIGIGAYTIFGRGVIANADVSISRFKRNLAAAGRVSMGTRIANGNASLNVTYREKGYSDLGYAVQFNEIQGLSTLAEAPSRFEAYANYSTTWNDYRYSFTAASRSINGEMAHRANLNISGSPSDRMNVFASLRHDFSRNDTSLRAGVSFKLGGRSVSSTVRRANDRTVSTASIRQPLGREIGDVGYSAMLSRSDSGIRGEARAQVRTVAGTVEGSIAKRASYSEQRLRLTGSIGAGAGGLYYGQYVHDSFALVDTGRPNVRITRSGIHVGSSSVLGGVVVPIGSFNRQRISHEPISGTFSEMSSRTLAVYPNSGLALSMGVREISGLTIRFVSTSGKPVSRGAKITVAGQSETSVVGVDGEAWVNFATPGTRITVTEDRSACAVEVPDFEPGAILELLCR